MLPDICASARPEISAWTASALVGNAATSKPYFALFASPLLVGGPLVHRDHLALQLVSAFRSGTIGDNERKVAA